ncbi:hypothetical protein KB449_32475 [Cohnella sp. F6_2S_P_1]|uniref:Uncharacterized protein n=1 Tax=Cohnella hashimotonis TaxID=2826895 RepID=A0ABT6TUT3_9BACL|nr:YheC/YheD family protein [Cohnella hashimotonis]MDI4649689.1 hypothetical protein [Cohnella hashimotonis]
MLKWLRKEGKGRGYIVQRRLQLARIQRKPFDIRVMVQRKKGHSSNWNTTGSYAKVAARGYLVTNVTSRTLPVTIPYVTLYCGKCKNNPACLAHGTPGCS